MATPRSGRWELLGHGSDPVPGSAEDVRDVAEHYRERAEELTSVSNTLRELSALSEWTGEAAETFAVHAGDGAEDIGRAAGRYDAAADAIETYADKVQTARESSWSALTAAVDADGRIQANSGGGLTGVTDPTEAQLSAESERLRLLSLAQQDLSTARSDLEAALSELERRARDCADALRDAEFGDGWFDNFKGFVRDHADIIKTVVEVLKWVAAAVAVVVLVLAVIATAPFALIALGVALAAAILLLDAALLTVGEATWGDVAWDLAGLALSAVGGRATLALTQRLTTSMNGAMGAIITAVRTNASASTPTLVRMMQGVRLPGLGWIGRAGDRVAQARVDVIANQAVRTIDLARPSALSRVLHLDGQLAGNVARINAMRSFDVRAAMPLLDDAQQVAAQIRNLNVVMAANDVDGAIDRVSPISINSLAGDAIDHSINEARQLSWRLQHAG